MGVLPDGLGDDERRLRVDPGSSSFEMSDVALRVSSNGRALDAKMAMGILEARAQGAIQSVYFLDPDQNLIEVSRYL